jgi:hypothetical protein
MAKTGQLKKNAAPYMRRLVEDERVHDHLADAAAGLRKAYSRGKRKKGAEAAEDKKLYAHVRAAMGSLRRAGMALQRKPPPKPKRRGRKLLLAGALIGGAWWVAQRGSDQSDDHPYADRPREPVEPAPRDQTVSGTPVA